LVEMRRWYGARIHKRIDTVDDELRATEPHHGYHALATAMLH
jgi:hypothetical protein